MASELTAEETVETVEGAETEETAGATEVKEGVASAGDVEKNGSLSEEILAARTSGKVFLQVPPERQIQQLLLNKMKQ